MYILSNNNSDKAIAIYLAKEGLEIAINMRDTNGISKTLWHQGIWPECQNGCQLDFASPLEGQVKPWIGSGDYLDNSQDFYRYNLSNMAPTKFKRKITTTLLSDYALQVTSDVFWDQRASVLNPLANPGHFGTQVILYNWQNN